MVFLLATLASASAKPANQKDSLPTQCKDEVQDPTTKRWTDGCNGESYGNNIPMVAFQPDIHAVDADDDNRPVMYIVFQNDEHVVGLEQTISVAIQLRKLTMVRNEGYAPPAPKSQVVAIDCRATKFCPKFGGTAPKGKEYGTEQVAGICKVAEFCAENPADADGTTLIKLSKTKVTIIGCGHEQLIPKIDTAEGIDLQADEFYKTNCVGYETPTEFSAWKLPLWAILLIVLGVLILVAVLLGGGYWYWKRRREINEANPKVAHYNDGQDDLRDYGGDDAEEYQEEGSTPRRAPALE